MQSKSIHEPFVRVVKRGEMPMKKKIAIRLLAVLLAEFCPVTNALRCVLAVLFLLGIGWMLWDRHWLAKTLEAEEKTEE